MKISKIFDGVWLIILICSAVLGFGFWAYILYISFLDDGALFFLNKMFYAILAMISLSFSYLIMVYIGRTKKDIEILEIMEQQQRRTDGYMGQVDFMKNSGPIGQGYLYLDHGGFFLLPFIQKRKNYQDIDVKKIPFKKKFPFILFFICTFSVPVLGLIAWWI
jgi:hypothetical protein